MNAGSFERLAAALPKAELHLHLEGSIAPETAAELAARHGVELRPQEVARRYRYDDFPGFLEAFKWVTSFVRQPEDYRLIADRLADELLAQNVVYAEVTLSVGVMLLRRQAIEANFAAVLAASERARRQGLQLAWIFDAVRQFGPDPAMEVARWAARMKPAGVVAFGLGGDELARPAEAFREVYDYVRAQGLHTLMHAGEMGGPEAIRDALGLGVERIGHGLAAVRDPSLVSSLAAPADPITLEICPTSNLRTGALARQLGKARPHIEDFPLRMLFERGVRLALSTDDPAMFGTSLVEEYKLAGRLGLAPHEIVRLAETSFESAFLAPAEKQSYLDALRRRAGELFPPETAEKRRRDAGAAPPPTRERS
jgi:aminodeoxyfutalosine deaminase